MNKWMHEQVRDLSTSSIGRAPGMATDLWAVEERPPPRAAFGEARQPPNRLSTLSTCRLY